MRFPQFPERLVEMGTKESVDSAGPAGKTAANKGFQVPSSIYLQLREAIIQKQQVIADYKGHHWVMCPHAIGTGPNGNEQLMAYQFDGTSSKGDVKGLSASDKWRCLPIDGLTNVIVQDGEWHTGDNHSVSNTCIASLDIEVSH